MNVIGWLVLVVGVVWLASVAVGGLLGVLGIVAKSATDKAELGATSVRDILGKKRLMPLYEAPKDLLELEAKLNAEDFEKSNLAEYQPHIYSPGPLEEGKYESLLPKLFKRSGISIASYINIEDVRGLTALSPTFAYELLSVANAEPPPKFPFPPLATPRPISPPCEWTEWSCNESTYDLTLPLYRGPLKPLNYFVERSFKSAVEQIHDLRSRQALAIEKANLRNSHIKKLYEEALVKHELAQRRQQEIWTAIQVRDKQRVNDFFEAYTKEKHELERLVSVAKSDASDGLVARIEQSLQLENFPDFVPGDFAIRLDEVSKILILEHEYPDVGGFQWIKHVSLKTGMTLKPANQKEIKEAATLLYPALSLRLACEIARLDHSNLLEAVVVNGWSNYIEKSTGQVKRAYCSSLFATKAQLLNLNLSAADPLSAFAALKGVAARSLELTPIAPILRLNTEDKRFVDAKEVLGNMAQGENLAAMDWEDFEHLCRQLFEKAFAGSGAEVKVTQASRDQGVDAVIFDPDVLRGGKIVVQAKRYTNTVDVSAVRDLYGAIINEGATKGILVTTSHYGPDAYAFAKDKPITLLNGEELLGLLQKYGYAFRIDLPEAKRLNSENYSLK